MECELDRLNTALRTRYTIKEELGRGAMATVYRAEDIKHGRDVAIKVLRPELVSGYEAERFFREIRTAARLTHPQILTVHDSGECDGFLYYVMPFVGCESLRDRLESNRQLPLEEAIRITETLARALDYAHRQGVLHRDIKPENILLNEGQPLLTDFGIATALKSVGSDRLTEPGLAVGTPAYMSPEQVTAERDLDGRSDLYSLACVAYEMLVGKPPFVGRSARATMALHAIEPAPSVRLERPAVPDAVEQALVRALAKEPDDRFANLLEFSEALTGSGQSTTQPGATFRSKSGARKIAVLPFENASPDPTNEYLSDGITDELIDALTKVNGLHVASRTSVFAFKGTRRDVRVIGAQLGVSAVLEGTVRRAGNRLRITARLTDVGDGRHLWSERYDRDLEDIFVIQDEIAQTIVGTLRSHLLGTLGSVVPRHYTENVRAYNLYLRGRYHWNLRTPEDIARAIEYFQQAIDEDPDYALAYTGLADAHAIQVDYRGLPVAEGMERAKTEARRALELDETLAEAHTSLAWVNFIYEWDWAAAHREFRRAIELDSRYATAHQWYAWLHLAMGRVDEALSEGRLAVELDAAAVSARRGLGWLHYYARRPATAIQHLQLARAIDPEAEETHRVLGLAYIQAGRYDAAERVLREAVRLSEEPGPYSLSTLGHLAALTGDRGTAQRIADDLLGDQLAGRYVSPVALATVYLGLQEFDRVFAALERAYQERRGWLAYLNVEPLLDPVRDDDRFRHLAKKMKLE
jgi:serine/threonine-protein kinase